MRFSREEYLDLTAANAAVIAELVQSHPERAVPSCPGWDLGELAFHTAGVFDMWAWVFEQRSLERRPMGKGVAKPPPDEIGALLRGQAQRYLDAVRRTDPSVPVWNWWDEQGNSRVPWRVTHEVLIHRWDAEHAVDAITPLAPAVAADGVDELLTLYLARKVGGPTDLRGILKIMATDTGDEWRLDLGSLRLADPAGPADAVLHGTAEDLLLALWGRHHPDGLHAEPHDILDAFFDRIS